MTNYNSASSQSIDIVGIGRFVGHWRAHLDGLARAAGLTDYVLTLSGFGESQDGRWNGLPPQVIQVRPVDDLDRIVQTVADLNNKHGYSVYASLAAFAPALKSGSRGNGKQVLFVGGVGTDLDFDHGNTLRVDQLPLPPSIDVMTSRHGGGDNHNALYLFDRAVALSEAERIALSLAKFVGSDDKPDGPTSDAIHVWRVPGTLNWPKKAKAKRGRSSVPQATVATEASTWTAVAPADLLARFGHALAARAEARRDASTNAATERSEQKKAVPASEGSASSAPHMTIKGKYNGRPQELDYITDAARHIDRALAAACESGETVKDRRGLVVDMNERSTWIRFGEMFHYGFDGSAAGERLWSAMSIGDAELGFVGVPAHRGLADIAGTWKTFGKGGKRPVTLATLFELASDLGFNRRREDYGIPEAGIVLSQKGAAVAAARDVWQQLKTQKVGNKTVDMRYRAKSALMRRASALRLPASTRAVLDLIADLINQGHGVAFISHGRIAAMLTEAERTKGRREIPWNKAGVYKALNEICEAGLIVMNGSDEIGARGHVEPTYAVISGTPEKGVAGWLSDIAWNEEILGHQDIPASPKNRGSGEEGSPKNVGRVTKRSTRKKEEGYPSVDISSGDIIYRNGETAMGVGGQPTSLETHPQSWLLTSPAMPDDLRDALGRAMSKPGKQTKYLELFATKLALVERLGFSCDLAHDTLLPVGQHAVRSGQGPAMALSNAVDALIELIGDRDASNAADLLDLRERQRRQAQFRTPRRDQAPSDRPSTKGTAGNAYRRARDGE